MSTSCLIVCLDCRIPAPPIGDFGFIGWPSMDESPTAPTLEQWDWLSRSFGYIRRTFLDLGICTDELERFAAFMRKHDGHNLGVDAEGELQHEFEGGQEIVDEIEMSDRIEDPLPYGGLESRVRDGFIVGRYALRCGCGASLVASEPTILRPLPEVHWTADLLTRLRDVIGLDEDFWRVTDPLIDPGSASDTPLPPLRQVEAFVAEHLAHGVVANAQGAADSR